MAVLSSLFYFVVALGLLIAIHEFGHFWVARRLGVKVLRYSIGFGKPLWTTRRGPDQTEYVVAALPFGGYVRMLDEREGEVAPHELSRAFNRQPVAKRFAIVFAGPLFNFLMAIAAYWVVFMMGVIIVKPIVGEVAPGSPAAHAGIASGDLIVAVGGQPVQGWQDAVLTLLDQALRAKSVPVQVRDAEGIQRQRRLNLQPVEQGLKQGNMLEIIGITPMTPEIAAVIGRLEPGEPAAAAGMRVGDRVTACAGKPVKGWEDWVACVREHANQRIDVQVERGDAQLSLSVQPRLKQDKDGSHGYVGAAVVVPKPENDALLSVIHYSPLQALAQGAEKTWDMSVLTLRMLWGMVTGHVSLSNISGPISIAKYAGASAHIGFGAFLTFLAVVSLSLGVLNLLPIPVLDGGHLFYYLIEIVKGGPLSESAQALGQRIGMALLLLLMAIAVYNDLAQIVE